LEIVIERIPIAPLKRILELCKKQTADIVIIPQCPGILSNERNWNIAGIVGGTIVSTSRFNDAILSRIGMLWRNVSVPYVAMLYKDINPFLKILNETDEIETTMLIHSYDINGIRHGIVFGFSVGKLAREDGQIIPNLRCMPYINELASIFRIRSQWDNSIPVGTLWLDEEKNFQRIWRGKASDGAKAWIPKSHTPGVDLSPYITYLSKTMFIFSKHDSVMVDIRDQIPGEQWNKFMVEFNVKRKGKGCTGNHYYTFMGFKL
jgi:hypothetical protein